jgi:hypothetical protein
MQTRDLWPAAWQQATSGTDSFLRLTPAELAELTDELLAVLRRWAEQTRDRPIEGERRHVFHFMHAFPEEVTP